MIGFQTRDAWNITLETQHLFYWFYYNRNITLALYNEQLYFFNITTKTNLSRSTGYGIFFYIRDYQLLFFDSFALEAMFWGEISINFTGIS